MKIKIFAILIAVGLLVLISGCIEEGTNVETALTDIRIGDMPISTFDHVNITFSEVKLHENIDDDNASWTIISSEPKTVDLINLHINNITTSLGLKNITIGNYSKLWIHVTNATGVLNATGENVEIDVPSGWLKIQQLHLFNITKGNNTIIIDIDLESSIHTYQHGEKYKFVPVISSLECRHENQLQFRHNKSKMKQNGIVENQEPQIDVLVNGTSLDSSKKVEVDANDSIDFNASATYDPEGDSLNFTWDFDDGTIAYGVEVAHSFIYSNSPYKVTLTVSDGTNTAEESFNVHINKEKGGPE